MACSSSAEALKTLYVLRHAKSTWADPALPDHDRPLSMRGVRACTSLARHLRHQGVRLDVVLCSSARRAQETLDHISGALGDDPQVLVEDELYGAGVETLISRLRRLDKAVTSAMVIGHNPALQALVIALSGDGDDVALASVRHKFATGSLATLSIPGRTWSRLGPSVANLDGCFVPRVRGSSGW